MVRFGWNLAQLFRDLPWSCDPGYTQIQQVNKSTLGVNTMRVMPKKKSQSKEKKWTDLGETWLSCSEIRPEAVTQATPKSNKSISQHLESTLRVNTMRVMPKKNHKVKRKNGQIWVKLGSAVQGLTLKLWPRLHPKIQQVNKSRLREAIIRKNLFYEKVV